MKKIKASYALLIAAGSLMTGLLNTVMAANYYWDGSSAKDLQSTNGVWADACWNPNSNGSGTLVAWPGGTTHNAYICANTSPGLNVVTISSPVSVNQLGLGWNGSAKVDGSWVTLTNSAITVGAGGIIAAGNKTLLVYSDVALAANQGWVINNNLSVYGNVTDNGNGYGITKTGTSTLYLYGTNSFSGDFVQGAGPVTVYSTSGLPLGSGSLTINNGCTLSITPAGTGSAVALSGGTNGNKTISFDGKAKIYINTNLQSSVTYTFGNSADTGSAFVRNNRGLLSIVDALTSGGIGVYGQFKLANGTNGVPIHNGMVDAYLTASDRTPYFMQYNEVAGFQKFTTSYSWGNGIQASVNDNTRVYQIGNTVKPVLTNDCSIYALAMTGSSIILTLSNNAVLHLGNGVQPAGLILAGSTITAAANSTGSRLDFGASEGIVYNTYNSSAAINVPIAGSGGVTFNINPNFGSLTLGEDNTYTGDTTIHAGNSLNIGTGGTRGSLASTNWIITAGGGLNFNRSDTVTWAGTMSGAGTVQNGGVGTLNLTLASSGNTMGNINNASTGTLVLDGAGSTTVISGSIGTTAGGTIVLSNGCYSVNQAISLSADTGGTTVNLFSMRGGKLTAASSISGANGAGAKQIFDFSGGTLAAATITATKLASVNEPTVQGTLVNNGGTLAPGDIGTAGKTTITGNYSNTVSSAVLAIDIGGTTQATAFQTGQYDYLNVTNGAATIAGRLDVRLINGYTPPTTDTKFTILAVTGTGAALSGTFANVTAGNVWCADGYSLFTNVTQNATQVILAGYVVNEYLGGSWDSASSWSQGVIPTNQNYAAYFGTLASSFSPNVGTRTLKGLIFANPSSFTLSGTALTLQGDASIKVTAGSHTISVPLALSNATEIAVAPDSLLTLSGGITGGQAVAKTGTGTLALSGVNTLLGALTVSEGIVRFAAGTTTVSALTLASGAKCDFVTGTLYILKNGGGTDTIEEVNAAITANAITLRGSNALPADFKVTEETINSVVYIKVVAKVNGTVISFQ